MRILLSSFIRCALVGAVLVFPEVAAAQRPAPRPVPTVPVPPPVDSIKAPLSPRRAFLYSFLLPGYSQSVLGRHKAGATFILVEAISLAMIRESAADVREARRLSTDSLVLSYVDQQGDSVVSKGPAHFNAAYVHTRQAHVEDWIALLVANHLFAGADAFVGVSLWDIPARLAIRATPGGGGTISASFKW